MIVLARGVSCAGNTDGDGLLPQVLLAHAGPFSDLVFPLRKIAITRRNPPKQRGGLRTRVKPCTPCNRSYERGLVLDELD